MTTSRRAVGRAGSIIAAAAALVLLGGSAASAHFCYKDQWAAAAHAHHAAGGTAWVPLSELGKQFISEGLLESCGHVADEAVEAFMAAEGLAQEPLIHSRAVVAGGAVFNAGKQPKPFSYLTEEQFGVLTVELDERLAECAAG